MRYAALKTIETKRAAILESMFAGFNVLNELRSMNIPPELKEVQNKVFTALSETCVALHCYREEIEQLKKKRQFKVIEPIKKEA